MSTFSEKRACPFGGEGVEAVPVLKKGRSLILIR